MAVIQDDLVLNDRYSRVIRDYINNLNWAGRINQRFGNSAANAARQTSGLVSTLKNAARAFIGFQSIKGLVNLSDSVTSTTARLNLMNDGLQTTEELNRMIYESAQRSRSSYLDTASAISKMALNAGAAFKSNEDVVAFMEQVNKQFVIAGASADEQRNAVTQLTQAMAAGALRGEELNSILDQAPGIARAIESYMGVAEGSIKQYAEQGLITSEVVKNALFSVADETNAKFASMPMTWGQVWTKFQNSALMALQPVLDGINWLANNTERATQWITENLDGVVAVLSGIGIAATLAGSKMAASAVMSGAAWAAAHLPLLLVTAGVAALIYAAVKAGATFQQVGGVIGGVFGTLAAFIMNNVIVPIQNKFAAFANFVGNFLIDPVASIKLLFYDLALSVLGQVQNMAHGLEDLINKIPGVKVNLTSGIDRLYNNVSTDVQGIKSASGWKEYVKAWDYMDYSAAWAKGAQIGGNLGSKLDNFNPTETIKNLFTSYTPYNELSSQLSGISDSVKGIEKSVSMSEEDIKALVDVAERRYVNNVNLTAQTPVITINGANTGHTAADRQNLANTIRDILIEQVSSGSTRTTARAF